jgi:hypothetical protein
LTLCGVDNPAPMEHHMESTKKSGEGVPKGKLLHVRVRVLNNDWENTVQDRYPNFPATTICRPVS